MKDDLKPLYKK
jgi:hypothetical protein